MSITSELTCHVVTSVELTGQKFKHIIMYQYIKKGSTILFVVTWLAFHSLVITEKIYNVDDYGAVGNGQTDDSQAFSKAWGDACADENNPTILLSSKGKTYLSRMVTFSGPCKSSIHVQITGSLVAPNEFWTKTGETWIIFKNINNLTVDGQGTIDGRGKIWWGCVTKRGCTAAPFSIEFMGCNDLKVSNINLKNSPGKHLAIYKCNQVKLFSLNIIAPGDSPNTDGIIVAQSSHVDISSSTIGVGDDCITISNGSFDVNVSRITCGPGHGISVGSLGKDSSVEKVHVWDSKIFNALTGARIKTWQGGSGYARNIVFEDIIISSVVKPIEVNQFYCPNGGCANQTSAVAISDVTFRNLNGTSTDPVAISLLCSQSTACTDIQMQNVQFKLERDGHVQSECNNVIGNIERPVVPHVPCLE